MRRQICGVQAAYCIQCLQAISHSLKISKFINSFNVNLVHFSANKLYKLIKEGIYDLEEDPWQSISEKAKDLVRKLLTVDPDQRISAKDALNHPWIKVEEEKPQTLQTVVNRMN